MPIREAFSEESCGKICPFPLDKSGFPSAVINTFLNFRVRAK
jgi:hypothetical protein